MLRFALLFLAFLALPVKAAIVSHLYQAQIVLPSTDQKAEQAAQMQGFEQVLVKVSGYSDIVNNPVIKQALDNSANYVSQFSFGEDNGQQTLDLTFDQSQIHQLLVNAQAGLWKRERPNILVWIVDDNNNQRNILWDQSDNPLVQDSKQEAVIRGIPVTFPIGDISDIASLNVSDVWGGFIDPVAKASERYHADGLLLVKAKEKGNGIVSLSWSLYDQRPDDILSNAEKPVSGNITAPLAKASDEMINQVTDYLAHKYAVVLGGQPAGSINIQVNDIKTADDYFALEHILNTLTTVSSENVLQIKGNSVIFNVDLLGSKSAFRRELSVYNRISQNSTMPSSPHSASSTAVDTSTPDAPATAVSNALQVEPDNIYNWQS